MKKLFLGLFFLFVTLQSYAGDSLNAILLERKGIGHLDGLIPADQPEVYYDSSNLEIIIEADGFACYYDVEIYPANSAIPIISIQIDGYGDTIDISSLLADDYTIIIYSPYNNQFEGGFTIE